MPPFVRSSPNEVRPFHIAVNVLSSCHSSAAVEIGNTRVLCAVKRPQQLVQEYRGDRGRIACEVHRVTSSSEKDDDTRELDLSLALDGVTEQLVRLEMIPQLLVEVALEIVQDDGALWDALSTALATALSVGGFEMWDMFSACSAALLQDGTMVIDVRKEEEKYAKAMVVVCSSLTTKQIVYLHHQGATDVSIMSQLVHAALSGSEARKGHFLAQVRGE